MSGNQAASRRGSGGGARGLDGRFPGASSAAQRLLAVAGTRALRSSLPDTDRGGSGRVPGSDHPDEVVPGEVLHLLRQADGGDQLDATQALHHEPRPADLRMERRPGGGDSAGAGNPQASLLELPGCRDAHVVEGARSQRWRAGLLSGVPAGTARARAGLQFRSSISYNQAGGLPRLGSGPAGRRLVCPSRCS